MNFSEYLTGRNIDAGLYAVLSDIAFCVKEISDALECGNVGYAGGKNIYGEKQIKMDVLANHILVSRLNDNSDVSFIASEEMELPHMAEVSDGGYSVCFDPLDGSSLVEANLAVGTIVGVYKGKGVLGRSGSEQVAAVLAIYGPRLSLLVTAGGDGAGVDEFIFDRAKKAFFLSCPNLKVGDFGKVFAPGNLGANGGKEGLGGYGELLNYCVKNEYKLRYSGGMAPDVNHVIKKGGGIFLYPADENAPEGKMRLLYECAPLALIMERAGGIAVYDKDYSRILDMKTESYAQTAQIFLGSRKDVEMAVKFLY